ncbi:replication initiation protein RepM [Acinetobacter soli]|uniref:replication initiation protein RepM n=1 Tax=Acinetobacter soli TaxID=487316 RepID=UPI00370A28C9
MKKIVVKDNALMHSSYSLDLTQQRLILLAIVEARESGRGINTNDPLQVHADSYANQFSVHRNTAYQALKDACNNLFNRQFSYQQFNEKNNVENILSRWVSEIRYVEEEAVVKLVFAPAVVPLITRLEEHFTNYELQQVSHLSSGYALRLYELLISWRSKAKTPVFELEDLRNKLGVHEKEYLVICDLKKRVIDLAIKQINMHTDITVKYEQHKKGRRISGFSFSFKQKKKLSNNLRTSSFTDLCLKMTDAQRLLFSNKLSHLPEMSKYSKDTESYQQFATRIAKMLQDPAKFQELHPYLEKVGYR